MNVLTVQETSPELFSLPNSPSVVKGTPVKDDKLSPKKSQPDLSPAFSPLDTQMLLFLEQQELAHCQKQSQPLLQGVPSLDIQQETPANNKTMGNISPDSVSKKSLGDRSQESLVFSPLDPEVLILMDRYQEAESKKVQNLPKLQKCIVSAPQTQQSSPSYSPLSSQALLFDDSTTSELDLSQAPGKELLPASNPQFTSTFPILDTQSLKLVDGFYSKRNELAANFASPALKSQNKPEEDIDKRVSLRTSHRRSSSLGRTSSNKKQKLVVTFCQSESPYSEFFQDEEMVLDLAETLECSFVIDRTEPFTEGVTQNLAANKYGNVNEKTLPEQLSANNQHVNIGTNNSSHRESSKRLSKVLRAGSSLVPNLDRLEPSPYSHLEEDLALAADWGDFFSFDEGQQQVDSSRSKSINDQDVVSSTAEKCNADHEDVKDEQGSEMVVHRGTVTKECNTETPQKTLRTTTQVGKSERKRQKSKTEKQKKVSVGESVDRNFTVQLSPGTVAMLDMFASDSFSRTSSPVTHTVSYPTSAPNCNRQLLHQDSPLAGQSRSEDLTSKSECNKQVDQTKRERRKRRSEEGITKLIQEDIPTKKSCQEILQQQRSPTTCNGDENETEDKRRKSDGDFIPPTPPKEKPNTPKLLKGTPKQRLLKEALEMDTPRSLRLRERSAAKLKQATNMIGSSTSKESTPLQRQRHSPQSKKNILKSDLTPNPLVSLKHLASSLNTPEVYSPMLSDVDLNAAQGESQLHIHLDSSLEIEPPTPPAGKPDPVKHPNISSSHVRVGLQHPSPRLTCTQGTFTIIDVCSSRELFQTFLKEWSNKSRYSLSVACEKYQPPVQSGGIGGNIRKAVPRPKKPDIDGFQVGDEGLVVTGVSICWEDKDAYFISLQQDVSNVDANDSLAQPPLDPALSIQERLKAVKTNLELKRTVGSDKDIYKLAFDCKEHYKVLCRGCGVSINSHLADPKVAHWLIDPGSKARNLHGLVTHYIPNEAHILEGISSGVGLGSLGLLAQDPGTGRLRAATESVLVLSMMDNFESVLKEEGLYKAFVEVEMPCMRVLARMELNGFGFSHKECETQKAVMQAKLAALEEQAYQIAGHGFSLTSPEDIAQLLYVELKLPPNGDPSLASTTTTLRKTLGTRGGRARLPKHFSTCKDSLEKLHPFHPLPGMILEWRRITAAVTKVVFPLQKEKREDRRLGGERIYATCQTHTATGRVSLFDPNIQAIPRDFEIEMPSAIGESPPLGAVTSTGMSYPTRARSRHAQGRDQQGRGARMAKKGCEPGLSFAVSIRHAFCPFQGGVLLAADYSQLELRILAHLSNDSKLAGILNGGEDVFKCIAAQWRQITEDEVNPKQRQQAKQICYGMVYGIGAKALGQQLGESEEDAAAFMDSFKMQYKGMKNYIKDTVDKCRVNGYVETILHRKRFLPAITHTNSAARNQAERQAVNTTIQGSAADLVKVAMVNIDHRLMEEFPNTTVTHRHREDFEFGSTQRKSRRFNIVAPSGAFLVLQLHDELIYEVHREDVMQVAQLVKMGMESAIKLSVRLSVKVKVGPTWGSMEELDI